jgi:hypothetical protein
MPTFFHPEIQNALFAFINTFADFIKPNLRLSVFIWGIASLFGVGKKPATNFTNKPECFPIFSRKFALFVAKM